MGSAADGRSLGELVVKFPRSWGSPEFMHECLSFRTMERNTVGGTGRYWWR